MEDAIAAIIMAFVAWLIYLLPTVLVLLPLWYLGRKRAGFMRWELIVLVLPFAVWLGVFLLSKDKSLGNIVETLILSGAVSVAGLIRVAVGAMPNRNLIPAGLMLLTCLAAVLLGIFFPKVPVHWFH